MLPEFHPAAEEELSAAMQHGEARAAGLGRELLVETRRIVSLLCQSPSMGEPLDSPHRRFPLRRFPFALLYRVDGDRLRIVAVAHRRQRPGYWRGRK
jgi:plasmid stabilization system protein ParE